MQHQIQNAVSKLQSGLFKEAAEISEPLVEKHPMAKMVFAIAKGKQGALSDAHTLLQQLHLSYPKNLDVLFNHGLLLKDNGDLQTAEEKFRACLDIQSTYHPALHALGNIYSQNESIEQALTYFQKAYANQPQNITYFCSYSDALCSAEKSLDATLLYSDVTLNGEQILRSFLRACYLSEQRELSKKVLRDASVFKSQDSMIHFYAGLIETDEKRYVAALEHFDKCDIDLLSSDDQEAVTLNKLLCSFLSDPLEHDLNSFVHSATSVSTKQGLQFAIRILDRLGELGKALDLLSKYQEQYSQDEFYLLQSSVIFRRQKNYANARECHNQYQREYGDQVASLTERAKLEDAESNFTEAYKLIKTLSGITESVSTASYDTEYKKNLPPLRSSARASLINIVAIVGYPRSGTTLLETQISEELPTYVFEETCMSADFFKSVAKDFSVPMTLLAPTIAKLQVSEWEALRQQFLLFAATYGKFVVKDELLVDKMPLNYAVLPAYLQLFPELTIIQCFRDPRDTFISSLMHEEVRVNSASDFLISFSDTVAFWKAISENYRNNCVEVKYEDFVSDKQKILSDLLARFSIKKDSKENKTRLVNSPSYLQTSEAMYTSSINRFQNYVNFITELDNKFDEVLIRLGYK